MQIARMPTKSIWISVVLPKLNNGALLTDNEIELATASRIEDGTSHRKQSSALNPYLKLISRYTTGERWNYFRGLKELVRTMALQNVSQLVYWYVSGLSTCCRYGTRMKPTKTGGGRYRGDRSQPHGATAFHDPDPGSQSL